jgi:Putative auto-transporter adhesin, head GIN domain
MRAVAGQGRWIWGLSGLITAAAIAIPGARLITSPGTDGDNVYAHPQHVVTRTETVPQPVTSLVVQSYGGQVQVTSGQVNRVQVTETIGYDQGIDSPPVVTQSVSGGRLSLSDPACSNSPCTVDFDVTVPPGVTVTVSTGGGPVTVSGTAGANLASGGGPVRATLIGGPATVNTGGGPLVLRGLSGTLRAETDGGTLLAQDIAAATATITTGGGDAAVTFATAPEKVSVSTDGGAATLAVPGGPYNLTANSEGGPQSVRIATDPTALPSITVYSGGGPLRITSSGNT